LIVVTAPALDPVNFSVACWFPFDVNVTGFIWLSSTDIVPVRVNVTTWPAPPLATTVMPFTTLEPVIPVDVHVPIRHESIGDAVVTLAVAVDADPPHATSNRPPNVTMIRRNIARS
jgi:hypothetical protein